MNERIDNLFVQARFDAGSEKQFNATMRDVYHKFAELIVRECVDIALKVEKNPYLEDYHHARQIIKNINKHFGVEQ